MTAGKAAELDEKKLNSDGKRTTQPAPRVLKGQVTGDGTLWVTSASAHRL